MGSFFLLLLLFCHQVSPWGEWTFAHIAVKDTQWMAMGGMGGLILGLDAYHDKSGACFAFRD